MARQALQGHIVHQHGEILYANRAAEVILTGGGQPLIGARIHDHLTPEAGSQLDRFTAEENNNIIELALNPTDNFPSYIVARTRPISWNGGPATELLLLDTTREKNAEAALEGAGKLKAIGQLAGQVAHDFNNLWGVISGNLELLEGKLSASAAATELQYDRYLSSCNTAVSRGVSLTREILSYARMPTGETREIAIVETIQKIHGLIDRATGTNVEVITRMEDDLWSVSLDESELDQAILNIALNAGEAMPEGGSFTIAARKCSVSEDTAETIQVPAGDWVAIAFSDTGTGMPVETKSNAFEPFFTTKENSLGDGLGLSQVRDFITRYNGQVTLQSTPDQGTTLTLYIPPAEQTTASATPPAPEQKIEFGRQPPSASPQSSPHVTRILIVEAERELRSMASMMLQRQGYAIQESHDAQSAEAALTQLEGLDFLVIDATLPGNASGPAIFEKTKARFPGVNVLFILGHEDRPDHRAAIESLKAPCLQKPFHRQELARRLRNLL